MPLAPPELSILTERDAAKSLGISLGTLRRERMLGRIGFIRMSRRIIRYTEQNLIDYLAAREEGQSFREDAPKRHSGPVKRVASLKPAPAGDPAADGKAAQELAARVLGARVQPLSE